MSGNCVQQSQLGLLASRWTPHQPHVTQGRWCTWYAARLEVDSTPAPRHTGTVVHMVRCSPRGGLHTSPTSHRDGGARGTLLASRWTPHQSHITQGRAWCTWYASLPVTLWFRVHCLAVTHVFILILMDYIGNAQF